MRYLLFDVETSQYDKNGRWRLRIIRIYVTKHALHNEYNNIEGHRCPCWVIPNCRTFPVQRYVWQTSVQSTYLLKKKFKLLRWNTTHHNPILSYTEWDIFWLRLSNANNFPIILFWYDGMTQKIMFKIC